MDWPPFSGKHFGEPTRWDFLDKAHDIAAQLFPSGQILLAGRYSPLKKAFARFSEAPDCVTSFAESEPPLYKRPEWVFFQSQYVLVNSSANALWYCSLRRTLILSPFEYTRSPALFPLTNLLF